MKLTRNYLKSKIPYVFLILCTVLVTIFILNSQGRSFFSASNKVLLWVGDIHSPETSQQLADPYSFTHILHGVVLFWIFRLLFKKVSVTWRFCMLVATESMWEIMENSQLLIDRYRTATIALGYQGDSILNSLSDITMCSLGFLIAYTIGFKKSLALFIAIEIFLMVWVRDSLLINIVMLIHPIEAIKIWQAS